MREERRSITDQPEMAERVDEMTLAMWPPRHLVMSEIPEHGGAERVPVPITCRSSVADGQHDGDERGFSHVFADLVLV
jgi:hypothetical protein